MLKTSEIKTVANRIIDAIPEIPDYAIVQDDGDFGRQRRDWDINDDQVFMVIVTPQSRLIGRQDGMRYANELVMFLIQPEESKEPDQRTLEQQDFCIDVERKITKLIQSWTGTLDCPVKNLSLSGSTFERVRGYRDTVGITATYTFNKNV